MTSFKRNWKDLVYPERVVAKAEEILSNVTDQRLKREMDAYKSWGIIRMVIGYLDYIGDPNRWKEKAIWVDVYCRKNYDSFDLFYISATRIEEKGEIFMI